MTRRNLRVTNLNVSRARLSTLMRHLCCRYRRVVLVGIRVADMSAESEAQLGLADRLIHVPVHELKAVGVIEATTYGVGLENAEFLGTDGTPYVWIESITALMYA